MAPPFSDWLLPVSLERVHRKPAGALDGIINITLPAQS
jgi:hypothetical protein